jgi:hypothetical protein
MLKFCALIVPFLFAGCIAGSEPGEPGDEGSSPSTDTSVSFGRTGTAVEALNGCPGAEEPCSCTGGIHNGQKTCTSNITQCFEFCTGRLP